MIHLDNQKYDLVGFMRNYKSPTYMAELTAKMCVHLGITLIYLKPSDVDMEQRQVKGKAYINNSWTEIAAELPRFIDISPYCIKRKNRTVVQYLRENTQLSDERRHGFGKGKIQNFLINTDKFSYLVIPTRKVNELNDIKEFVNKYTTIVLKPLGGERGRGVYILKKDKEDYLLGYQKSERSMSGKDLSKFFTEEIEGKRYILQKYINSRSVQGDPFDCRVHVEKSGSGKWVSARNFIRIGIGQKVISNVSQGGGISDVEPFLRANFGEKWEEINDAINKLAVTLPYTLEKLRGSKVMTLGMDVGIDEDGSLYLFEVNSAPITKPLRDIAVSLRVDYYSYMVQSGKDITSSPANLVQAKEEENKVLTEKNKELNKKMNYYKKRYQQIESSNSWKLSAPLRFVGKTLKRFK